MLAVDPEFGISVLRLWVAAGSAALLILLCVLALFQPQLRMAASPVRRAGFVIVGAVLGAALTWAFLGRVATGDRNSERRAIEMRAGQLSAQALAPGSPLACLDAAAGESVEAACEKALFVSPASVASASSYVAARLTLLSSITAYAARGGADIDDVRSSLLRALETDRFGFVAHVLAIREGCTSENCKTLALLHDASRVRANLSAETLDRYLEHYVSLWANGPEGADGTQPRPTAQLNAQGARKMVNIDFPTAASIPAVSIMNPEPSGPVLPGVAAAAASNPNPAAAGPTSARHAKKQAANPPVPTTLSGAAAPDPIWPEPVPLPPAPAPQTASAPAVAPPVQLNPPAANANAGAAVRAQ
jgi:hypothetical protein